MPNTDHQQLYQLAFKGERAAAAQLAARQQISPEQALRQVLSIAAGKAGLAQLLAERQAQAERVQRRQQARAATWAQRQRRDTSSAGSATGPVWRGWFDGSALPNPGRIGLGALLLGPQGEELRISQPAGYGNSSVAEYLALTALLQAAVAAGISRLIVHGDSQVVVNDVNLTPQAVAAGQAAAVLAPYRQQVCALMAQIGEVELRWLPRHRNSAADQLAQQAVHASPVG